MGKLRTAALTAAMLAAAACGSPTASARTIAPRLPAGQWRLTFDDEFNGSSLNGKYWNTGWFGTGITKPVNPSEDDCYSPANVNEQGGNLGLGVTSQPSTCGVAKDYTGALVNTDGKFQFTYGYVEAQIWLPSSSNGAVANWPALWADGQNWPVTGEMDIMEGLNGQACWHYHNSAGAQGSCAGYSFGGWHTYGADWEPNGVTYYYDGAVVGTTTNVTGSPMYLILDSAIGGAGGVSVSPATMLVNYVKVWQH